MPEERILKPKSFRIDDKTAEKFKEISNAIGGNQQETLAKLIETFEFQSGKAVLTDKKADIEQFEKYINILTRMYMNSLEDNQNITELVRTEYDALLKSKDAVIQDLQKKIEKAESLKVEYSNQVKIYTDENDVLKNTNRILKEEFERKTNDMQSMLVDKDNLNKTLSDSCDELKIRIANISQELDQISKMKIAFDDMKMEYNQIIDKCSTLEKDLQKQSEIYERQITELKKQESDQIEHIKEQSKLNLDKAVVELERKHQVQIQQLTNEHQAEIDKYHKRYFDLLISVEHNETLNSKTKKANNLRGKK